MTIQSIRKIMGHTIGLLVLLFMTNITFADANSLARIGVYQSNRLLPPAQTTDAFDAIHFNIASYSWVDARLYNAKQSDIYGNMTTEDWRNLDLSLESNPEAKEAIEWLLAKYIWDDACNISASDIDELLTKYESLNTPNRVNNAINCIGFECPRDTPIDLLTKKLVDAGILRCSRNFSPSGADIIRVTTKEAILNGSVPRMGAFYYRNSKTKTGWMDLQDEDMSIHTDSIFKKGNYLYLIPTTARY